jgi:spermidine/putrescine transport system substrate-binding protein
MSEHQDRINLPLLRGLTQRRLSRRDMFRYAGTGAGAAGLSAFLAACGVSGEANKQSASDAMAVWDNAKKEGLLNFANWDYYIDKKTVNGKVVYPSLDLFTKDTGIKVKYTTPITDTGPFVAQILPTLQAGDDTGYDLMVLTNGVYLSKLIRLGYLIPLEQSYLKNFDKYAADAYKDPSYDPGNKYTIPWQSGITGIGYDPNLTGRKITSFKDLLDPEFKGKVGMFGDTADLPNLSLLGIGVNCETSTPDDWREAAKVLQKAKDDGIVRQFYLQNYIGRLQNGDVALSMAWSGDIYIANHSGSPQLEFVVPEEGGVIWTDNQCIPAQAQHPVDAITYMDYVYQPDIAAMIADWVGYITPVPASQPIVKNQLKDPGVASSPLVFPTTQMYDRTYRYRVLTLDEEKEWNSIFEPIYQG